MLTSAVFGQDFLLPQHRLDTRRALPIRQHGLRRFPASLPRHRPEQLSAGHLRLPRKAIGHTYGIVVLALLCGGVLIPFRRYYDRLIPPLCRRRLYGFYPLASGHGHTWKKNRGPHWG